MVKTTMYEAPSMTEFELLSEQAFLGNSLMYGGDNLPGNSMAGYPMNRVDIWGNEDL